MMQLWLLKCKNRQFTLQPFLHVLRAPETCKRSMYAKVKNKCQQWFFPWRGNSLMLIHMELFFQTKMLRMWQHRDKITAIFCSYTNTSRLLFCSKLHISSRGSASCQHLHSVHFDYTPSLSFVISSLFSALTSPDPQLNITRYAGTLTLQNSSDWKVIVFPTCGSLFAWSFQLVWLSLVSCWSIL